MRRALLAVGMVGAMAAAGAQTIVTPVSVHKDGEASATGYVGSASDVLVDGGGEQVTAWMTFQTDSIDMTGITKGVLVLYVKDVESPGTVRVHALTAKPSSPETHMTLADIACGIPVDSVTLGTADIESVIELDLTAELSDGGKTFHGVALTSDDGLRAAFAAKEGDLQPKLLLTHTIATTPSRWLTGNRRPLDTQGAYSDMFLETTTGDVYQKRSGFWTLTGNITGADGLGFNWRGTWSMSTTYSPNDAVSYMGSAYMTATTTVGAFPTAGAPWSLVARQGEPGTSSWTDGSGIVTTTQNVGIGTSTPSERLEVNGNMRVTGDLTVAGTIHATIDVGQLTGFVAEQQSPYFQPILYNTATLEVAGEGVFDTAIVVSGPGVVIDRIEGYMGGKRADNSGVSQETDFVVDLYPSEAANLMPYFDGYPADPTLRSMSLIITWLFGAELYRWNMFEFAPDSYVPVPNTNRTRFTFVQSRFPDHSWECQTSTAPNFYHLANAASLNYPTETQAVEIDGVANFCPQVAVDTIALTVTFDYYAYEANDALRDWAERIVTVSTSGEGRKNMSIIDLAPIDAGQTELVPQTGCYEIGRVRYYECFPIRFQMMGGYRMPETLREQIVIAYGWRDNL